MDDKSSPIVVEQVYDFNKPIPDSASDYEPFLVVSLSWKTMTSMAHDRLNFKNRASMLRRLLAIPFYPPKFCWCVI